MQINIVPKDVWIIHSVSLTEMKVFTDKENPLYSAQIPSFSSCLYQVWHFLFWNILLKKKRKSVDRGKLSFLSVSVIQCHLSNILSYHSENKLHFNEIMMMSALSTPLPVTHFSTFYQFILNMLL